MPRHSTRSRVPNGKLIRKSGLFLSLVFTLVFLLAPLSRAQVAGSEDGHGSPARIARISFVAGGVQLDSGHGYESVTMNVPVTEHNWLQTHSNGWAEVQMEDGSMLRLAPDTTIGFTQLGRSSSGGTITVIDLDQGEAEFKILKHNGSDFNVTVKNKTIALGQTGFFRVTSTNDDPMEIAVWKGDLGVRDGESGDEVAVKNNETFVLDPNDVGRYALEPGPEADELDEWSKQRDASQNSYAAANPYTQSPYQYGASDLNYYGQYTQDPEYGNVWQPNGVSQDWDPFSNGYYANSGLGATFISAYPWGWMPYRYGRWVFISGRGWFWAPGGWNKLNTLPRIANAPPGFHAPIPPADLKVVRRAPSNGTIAGTAGHSFSNNGGEQNLGHVVAERGSHHVFTNDEVQTIAPHPDTVPHPESTKTRPAGVSADRATQGFAQQQRTNNPVNQSAPNRAPTRVNENRLPPRTVNRPNPTPVVSRPARPPAPQPRASSDVIRERDRVREDVPLSQLPSVVAHFPTPGHETLSPDQQSFIDRNQSQNPYYAPDSYGPNTPSTPPSAGRSRNQ
jgi:hypothetical protein